MKKLLLLLLVQGGAIVSSWSQGTVNFANSVTFSTTADRVVRNVDGIPLAGSDLSQPASFVAQLYYGANAGSLQAHTATPARFRPGTTGLWLGGSRTLTGFAPGQTLTLQVHFWDSTGGLSLDQVRAAGGIWGMSAPFSYTIPADPLSPPAAYFMENFRGMALIPEPAPLLLLGAAIPALWLVMRRRGSGVGK